ncbi:MAG: hypothetical protein LCH99_14610 [Proteobacteria bacterium]|nr:hypothetical protein [Pseudomonadota bacterium]
MGTGAHFSMRWQFLLAYLNAAITSGTLREWPDQALICRIANVPLEPPFGLSYAGSPT